MRRDRLRRTLRLQEPGEEHVERHATWTELFFDLVFVVAIAQLASGLHAHVSPVGALTFVGLCAPVCWTWVTYAYAADLFDADDGPFRLVLVGAMLLAGVLAATIPAAFDGRTGAFVIVYALLRADLLALYAGAWLSDPRLRSLVRPHLLVFGLGGLVWLGSLLFAPPARYLVWALAVVIDLLAGIVTYLGRRHVPRHRSHMPERFGLFTLIVLGESVIAISTGTARASWAVRSALTAGLGFALAAGLWWMYFARFDETIFDRAQGGDVAERRRAFVFGYCHLALFAALAAVGVGIRLAAEDAIGRPHAGHAPTVLGIAVAGALGSLSLIQWAAPAGLPAGALTGRLAIAAAALAIGLSGDRVGGLATMTTLALGVTAIVVLETHAGARSSR